MPEKEYICTLCHCIFPEHLLDKKGDVYLCPVCGRIMDEVVEVEYNEVEGESM